MPTVIGRDAVLGQAAAYLEGIKGGPSSLLVNGDPGVGKTTLWESVVTDALRHGFRVLRARGSQSDSALTFGGLTDLLADVSDPELADLPSPQRTALSAALLREDVQDGRHDRRAVSAATLTLLRRMSGESPVLIAIDDLHWCDRPSARIVEYVARRLVDERIGVLCSQRAPAVVGLGLDQAGQPWQGRGIVIDLAPLDNDAIERIARAAAADSGEHLSLRQVHRIRSLAGGNPLFAVELARAPQDHGLPTSLRQLVHSRVQSLTARSLELLLLIATMREPTLPQVAHADGLSVDEAFSALESAADCGVLLPLVVSGTLRFGHPLYAAGVRAISARSAKRRAHLQVAQVVDDSEERVWHLARAATGPDDRLALQLDVAGERARARGAPEAACDLMLRALRLTPPDEPEDVFRRAVTVAELQIQAGEIPAARDALEELLATDLADHQRARVLRVLAELLYHQDSFADAIAPLTEALELEGDPDGRGHALVHLAYVTVSVGGFEDGRGHAAAALRLVPRVRSSGLRASIHAVSAMAEYLVGNPVDEAWVRRALELEDPNYPIVMTLRPSLVVGHLRLYEGRLGEAASLLSAARSEAIERGNENDVIVVAATLAWVHWWRCDLATAAPLVDEALEVAHRLRSEPGRCMAYAYGAVHRAFSGDLEVAREYADLALHLSQTSGFVVSALWAWWAQVVTALQSGEPTTAQPAVEALLGTVDALGLPTPVRVMALADAIEVLIEVGDLDRAATYIDVLDDSATRTGTEWATMQACRCRAQHLAASGRLDEAWLQVVVALGHCDTHELVIESARTRLAAGQIARRRRQKREAHSLIERACASFVAGGASGFAALAEEELGRVMPGASPDGELTPTELRVARLAAAGLTNREVASRLNISPKTVESNLSRVYRKLGITSRAELGAHFGAAAT